MDGLDPFDGDEDAALRYAIALSLQEADNEPSKKPIELSSDEDDNLDKGPKYPSIPKGAEDLSTKQSTKGGPPKDISKDISAKSQQSASTAPSSFTGLGLDRKRMEEERLARLGKRKAPESEPDAPSRRQRPKLDSDLRDSASSSQTNSATKSGFRSLPYPKGVVKKTWAAGFPRADDIKIEEVLQKNELQLAVISSFQWDQDWMLSKIDFAKTKVVCIAFASGEAQVRV